MGRQDYDGGYSSSGTGAAATSSSFSGGYSDPYESTGTVGTVNFGSSDGNRFDSSDDPFYRSQINRGGNTTPRETKAQREERLRKEGLDKARAEVEGHLSRGERCRPSLACLDKSACLRCLPASLSFPRGGEIRKGDAPQLGPGFSDLPKS